MVSNKKPNETVSEQLINSLVFITQSFFAVAKGVRLNLTHFFIMKTLNKQELRQIAFNHSSDIEFEDLINLYK